MSAAVAGRWFTEIQESEHQSLSSLTSASSRRSAGPLTLLESEPGIANIRARIASDTYITDDMIDVVVDRLLEELLEGPA